MTQSTEEATEDNTAEILGLCVIGFVILCVIAYFAYAYWYKPRDKRITLKNHSHLPDGAVCKYREQCVSQTEKSILSLQGVPLYNVCTAAKPM